MRRRVWWKLLRGGLIGLIAGMVVATLARQFIHSEPVLNAMAFTTGMIGVVVFNRWLLKREGRMTQ